MNRKNLVAGAVLLSGLLMASQADAFVFWECSGNPVVWGDPFEMTVNTDSIPPGTPPDSSLINAVDRWNGVQGMKNMVSFSLFSSSGPTISIGDGQNDVGLVNPAKIGGNNGLTFMFYSLCVLSSSWQEADVTVAVNLNFGPVAEEQLTSTSGRSTFLHEFGHAHGLAHVQGFNNMRTPQPRPVVGGTGATVDVLPDDANGGRFLYPSGNQEVNVFASAFRRTGKDQIVLNHTGSITACSGGGGSVTLAATTGNNGTVNVTQTERWWVSTNSNAHNGGIQIFQLNNVSVGASKVKQETVSFKLPPLPVGTYFLFHGVDVLDNLSESREDDNAVREGLTIKVINC
jgi:hypothetical protein